MLSFISTAFGFAGDLGPRSVGFGGAHEALAGFRLGCSDLGRCGQAMEMTETSAEIDGRSNADSCRRKILALQRPM